MSLRNKRNGKGNDGMVILMGWIRAGNIPTYRSKPKAYINEIKSLDLELFCKSTRHENRSSKLSMISVIEGNGNKEESTLLTQR